jgi:hypothetical protein
MLARMAEADRIRDRVRKKLVDQRQLVQRLLRLREQIEGSLIERWAECGKEGCACQAGRRHGPYFVLSARTGGRGSYAYLSRDQATHARGLVRHRKEFGDGMRRLKTINEEVVALLIRYRAAVARQGQQALEKLSTAPRK